MNSENLANKCYFLTGKKAFFHRFCDSSFRTKWTGLWSGSRKFLDYFAFKVNEEWLSLKNCSEVSFDDSSFAHIYSLDEIEASEKLSIPDRAKALLCRLSIKNQGEAKEIEISPEIGINIREREENWHERKYWSKKHENMILINSEKGSVAVWISKPFEISGQEIYRDHFPGELERCYIPGKISIKVKLEQNSAEEFSIIFACGKNEAEAVLNLTLAWDSMKEEGEKKENFLSGTQLKTGIKEIDEIFRKSVIGLEKLKFESETGFGFVAGLPWFTQFWGRDLGWMIPAIVDYGNFEDARKALETLMKFQSNEGEIPNFISLDGKPTYGSIDATPLWIIALTHYIQNSGDLEFLKESRKNILKALGWCMSKTDDGLLEAEKRSTWMDTLDRDGKPIEVQAIWHECLLSLKKLSEILGEDLIDFSYLDEIKKKIEEFWNPSVGLYFDRIKWKFKDESKTINSIFPVFFKISKNPLKVLEKIESEEFTSPFGVRNLSNKDPSFNPVGYHTGSIWSWITGLVASAEFSQDRPEKGFEYLKILWKMFDKNCLGSLDEAWNSENGDAVLLKEIGYEPSGFFQGWGFASVIRCIDEHMLGLKVDAFNKTIFASPSLLDGMKILRRKRIGNDVVEILMERKESELKINLKSGKGKGYKLVKIPKI
ncbi:MAG: amylo-alpha-1,6-glucosidase [Candidatus Aenigmatarchaeota archaeon]